MRALPTYDDVVSAAGQIEGHALRTPVLTSEALDAETGAQFFFKAENLQRIGAFKFRGAFNALTRFSDEQKKRGVIAFSSGNHAQAVAYHAARLRIAATIVMPVTTPAVKVASTRAYGATVVLHGETIAEAQARAEELRERHGLLLIHPYDDPRIIAGQGTVGLELAEQAAARGAVLNAVTVCCGGGGLVAGCALALTHLVPGVAVHSVEPAAFDDTARSLVAGRRLGNPPEARSFCDALLSPMPGELTSSR